MRLSSLISRREALQLSAALSRKAYLELLGFAPFPWQTAILESDHRRKIIDGARQSGKSTVVSGAPCWTGKYIERSLSIIAAATEKQAVEDMEKVKDFIARDPDYPKVIRDSDSLVELDNGSRILVVPATEKAARGYSNPDVIVLDEASRIEDPVYRSGIRPMLTDNPKCELILISTPHGRSGFFYRAWHSDRWEKYEIRSPYVPIDEEWKLQEDIPEKEYRASRASAGIRAWFSPRHHNLEEQQENLDEMGPREYRQEYDCEFVEPEDQVFSYQEIAGMFTDEVKPMSFGLIEQSDEVRALEVYKEEER